MIDALLGGTVGFAIAAGVWTFFAPCAYPLLPGYVGFYVSQTDGPVTLVGALSRGIAAGFGVLAVIGATAAAAVGIGQSRLSGIVLFEPLVGVVFVVAGIAVALDLSPPVTVQLPRRRASLLGFVVFGAGYALAAVACLAPVFLALFVRALSLPPAEGVLAIGAYAVATAGLLTTVTVLIAVGVDTFGERTNWFAAYSKPVAAALLIAAGIGQLGLSISGYGGF